MTDNERSRAMHTWNIPHWSDGYVDIDDNGRLLIRPHGKTGDTTISLPRLVGHLREKGARLPVLIRFSDILHDRVNGLCAAFQKHIDNHGYRGRYTAVYPVKVNQQRRVVEEIIRAEPAASKGQIGLEAGSKPELFAVLALSRGPGSVIVCNGYKDREYIRLALLGRQLGHRVFIVVEKQSELALILEEASELGVSPLIGVRARLASIGHGNWQNTGGEKSKFGLSAGQILELIEQLREAGALEWLQMLHFHLGSQIANIRDIQSGLRECARFYRALHEAGAAVTTVDIGGGLGVDYEGTRSRSACSMNYSMDEYARNVVQTFKDLCAEADLPHPELVSESGRALTAHHAVIVTNVVDRETPDTRIPDGPPDGDCAALRDLWHDHQLLQHNSGERSPVEIYHDAVQALADIQTQFSHGLIPLTVRAQAERIHNRIGLLLQERLNPGKKVHREILDELNEKLASRLFVNFSMFQSLPDVWGINQIFPILPLEGLHRPPTQRALIRDMTCDSDGRLDHYVDGDGIEATLPLPEGDDVRYLAFFLTGAYQEILGDMHNLFGDTDAADIRVDDNSAVQVTHMTWGQTLGQVLELVNYRPEQLLEQLSQQLDAAGLPGDQRQQLLQRVRDGLEAYTYLDAD